MNSMHPQLYSATCSCKHLHQLKMVPGLGTMHVMLLAHLAQPKTSNVWRSLGAWSYTLSRKEVPAANLHLQRRRNTPASKNIEKIHRTNNIVALDCNRSTRMQLTRPYHPIHHEGCLPTKLFFVRHRFCKICRLFENNIVYTKRDAGKKYECVC